MFKFLSRVAPVVAVMALAGAATPARAALVLLNDVQLSGQGIGSTTTALTLQAQGGSSVSGGVLFNGDEFGDVPNGNQHTTFTLAGLGLSSTSQLAIVVNLAEANENPPSVTTASSVGFTNPALTNSITLNVYNQAGTIISQQAAPVGLVLNDNGNGVGGSGIVFTLAAADAAALDLLLSGTAGTEVFTWCYLHQRVRRFGCDSGDKHQRGA